MKISKQERKKIEKEVEKYIKSLAEKDGQGNIINDGLNNDFETLEALYRQPFFIEMNYDYRLIAKHYFKSKLPYKEWRDKVSKNKMFLDQEIEDFQEAHDRRYQRKTPRGRNVP